MNDTTIHNLEIRTKIQEWMDANPTYEDILKNEPPTDVIDKEAYYQYFKIMYSSEYKDRVVTLSNGKQFGLGTMKHHFDKYMEQISYNPEEVQRIKEKKDAWMKLQGQALQLRVKAWGAKQGIQKKELNTEIGTHEAYRRRKADMIELFGKMFTVKEVWQIAVKDWSLNISLEIVRKVYYENKEAIAQAIEEHRRTHGNIRLSVKRSRLEELTYLYEDRKRIYKTSKKQDDYKLLISTLEQIRKEAEGQQITIDAQLNIDISIEAKQHLKKQVFNNFSLKEIIIAKAAAKMSISPLLLMARMEGSYYAKFGSVFDPNTVDDEEDFIYPSAQNYNFNEIEKKHKSKEFDEYDEVLEESKIFEQQQQKILNIDDMDEDGNRVEQIEKPLSIKDKILKKLNEAKAGSLGEDAYHTAIKNKE